MPETLQIAAVYAILSDFGHDSGESKRNRCEHPSVVFRLVHSWSTAGKTPSVSPNAPALDLAALSNDDAQDLDYDDPLAILIRDRKLEKQKQQDIERIVEQHLKQRETLAQDEADKDDRRRRDWLGSEQYRRAMAALSADVDDARQAISKASARAAAEQQQTQEALAKAQRNALVVTGDRRVYFTRDGRQLYGEDDRQITDAATVAEAQRQQRAKPAATTYEEYAARTAANREAAANAKQLDDAAKQLEQLDRRIKKGDLSPEELAQARQDKQDIIGTLPAEAREEYERLQAARTGAQPPAYKAADPAFTSAPVLSADFQQAVTASKTSSQDVARQPQSGPSREPAYKAAPEY